jgi:hypothetical protein
VQVGRDLIDGWVAEMTGATPGHLDDGRRPTAMKVLGQITVAATKGLTDFRTATTEVGDAFVELFENEEAAEKEFVKMAENVVAYRVADAAEEQVEDEPAEDRGGTPIPLSKWRIIEDELPVVASHRFRLTTGDRNDLIVELSRVNALTSPVIAQVEVQVPASDESIVERSVYIDRPQSIQSLAGRMATGSAGISNDDLFIVLRYLFNRVVSEAETVAEVVNLATVEITEASRILMFEQNLIDGTGTTFWYGKGGTGKSSMALGVAVDCSSSRTHEDSFLGFRYRGWRPFLYLDYEESRHGGDDEISGGAIVFKTKIDAVCKSAEVDPSEVAVHFMQPQATFARAYVEVARRRAELTERYGVEPITIIDSMQGATGYLTQSEEATGAFLVALDAYGGIVIVIDHEAESNASDRLGKMSGKSVKTQTGRLGIHFGSTRALDGTTMTVKKANHAGGRVGAVGNFVLEERFVGDPLRIDTIRFRMSGMKDLRVAGADRPTLTNDDIVLVWAHLTDKPISSKSFEEGSTAEKVFNKRVAGLRNNLNGLVKKGLFDLAGSEKPFKYTLTDKGTEQAKTMLGHYPEIVETYNEKEGQ